MFRIFLIPTDEFPKKELWLEAIDVHDSNGSAFWSFVDRQNELVRRIEKSWVKAFEQAADRRKATRVELAALEPAIAFRQGVDHRRIGSPDPIDIYAVPRSEFSP
jgi:hypothetical protein